MYKFTSSNLIILFKSKYNIHLKFLQDFFLLLRMKRLSTDMCASERIVTSHGHMYMMIGSKFQTDFVHYLLQEPKCKSARLSLTFRLTAKTSKAMSLMDKQQTETPSCLLQSHDFVTHVVFADILKEVYACLENDICKRGAEIFTNNGRKCADLMHPLFGNANEFTYTYGGKSVPGKQMGPILLELTAKLQKETGRIFDWCHVVLYPDGMAKIAVHSDDEKEIAIGSDIACLTFMEDVQASRKVFVKPKGGLQRKTPKEKPAKKAKLCNK